MYLQIEHKTRYVYESLVDYTIQYLRMTPQSGFGQHVKHWDLRVNGKLLPHVDAHGNRIHTLVIDSPHQEINITAYGEVETDLDMVPQFEPLAPTVYLRITPLTMVDDALRQLAQQTLGQKGTDTSSLDALVEAIRDHVRYSRGATNIHTSAIEAYNKGEGVCQDHAHIFIACCRYVGVPARYVSGYLFTEDGHLVESHAWADAWIAGQWHSFDVSNGQRTNDIHVRLAVGLDYQDACPISGIRRGGGNEQMQVKVQMSQSQQ